MDDHVQPTRTTKEDGMKKGKTFYKGRYKQVKRDKNPAQWTAYNRAPRVQHTITHYNPLASQLLKTRETGILSTKSLQNKKHENESEDETNMDQAYLTVNETTKLLAMSKQQIEDNNNQPKKKSNKMKKTNNLYFPIATKNIKINDLFIDNKEYTTNIEQEIVIANQNKNYTCETTLTENEKQSLNLFMPKSTHKQLNLSDIILNRVKSTELSNISNAQQIIQHKIPKKVIAVYKDVGLILSKWRSGNLPKAFKILPQLQDWEEILYITNPDEWTPHILFQATKMFSSQANKAICQRFYNCILLPTFRESLIGMNGKLNFHIYQALRKALFKPQAFFRGFLLPLCSDSIKAREAIVLGSVLSKNSIPVIQSALAIYKMLEYEYSGGVHYLLKVLLNKRYALPMKVISALVLHWKGFEKDERYMPVIWHQAFLVFVERYKNAMSDLEKESLKRVLKTQFHHQITPIIRRELYSGVKNEKKNGVMQRKMASMNIDIDI